MTLNQLLKIFETFKQRTHSRIKSFTYSDPRRIRERNIAYPLMVALPSIQTISENEVHGKITVMFLDRVRNLEDGKQIREVYSDMFERCKDLTAFFQNNDVPEIELNEETVFEPITDIINTDNVVGWATDIMIITDFDASVCEDQLTIIDDVIQLTGSGDCNCLSGSSYSFSAGTNLLLITGSTDPNITFKLDSSISNLDEISSIGLIEAQNGNINSFSFGYATGGNMDLQGGISVTDDIFCSNLESQFLFAEQAIYLEGSDITTLFASNNMFRASAVTGSMFTGSPKTAQVTFTKPFSDNNYSVGITIQSPNVYTPNIESKTPSGFVINLQHGTAPTNPVLWTAIKWQ